MKKDINGAKVNASRQIQLLDCIIARELLHRDTSTRAAKDEHICPHCGSASIRKRGFDAYRKQRYFCSQCSRSFTSATGSELSSTNLPIETWLRFAECYVYQLTLRESAAKCGISLKTAHYMRRRLNATIQRYSQRVKLEQARLKDIQT